MSDTPFPPRQVEGSEPVPPMLPAKEPALGRKTGSRVAPTFFQSGPGTPYVKKNVSGCGWAL